MLWSDENTFCAPEKQNNDFIQQYLVMGDFKTLLHEASKLYKSFVSNQRFGACIKLPKSHDFSSSAVWHVIRIMIRHKRFITLRSFMKQCFEIGHHYISRYFVFLAHQKYSCHFIILILNHCTHMNWFKYVFSTLMDLERGNVIAGNGGLTEPSDFIKNILICVPKMNEGLMGVERHEGE